MANLFSKAKKEAVTKAPAADSKVRINVNDASFFDKISKLEKLNDQMKSDKAKADMISDEVRDVARQEWAKLYEKTGKNPESVMIESRVNDDVAQVMLIVQDKYISVDSEKVETLVEEYGDSIVTESTTFSFSEAMIEKYGEVLSNLIMNSNDIDEADKDKIIKATTKFSIAKGTIDVLPKYGNVGEVMEAIRPVVMLKGPEVIKS